ncbi:MAG: HEAT repeat domain-containing protein [Gemmataceae bacterium]
MKVGSATAMGLCLLFCGSAWAEEPEPSEVLDTFQKAWKPLTGRDYMRPLDDQGWKARYSALRHLARGGDKVITVLVGALKNGDDETRVFAAQALSLLPDPAARPALEAALRDKHPAVRMYALDTFGMLGRLPKKMPYTTLASKDPNRDVRSHATFAMERDDQPRPEVLRQLLSEFDPKTLARAKLGEKAPAFALLDPNGKKVQLADYLGKKKVVLVFVYGDT